MVSVCTGRTHPMVVVPGSRRGAECAGGAEASRQRHLKATAEHQRRHGEGKAGDDADARPGSARSRGTFGPRAIVIEQPKDTLFKRICA